MNRLDQIWDDLIIQQKNARNARLSASETQIRAIAENLTHGEFIEILERVYHEQESRAETITGQYQWRN